jgi:hypothetical protein
MSKPVVEIDGTLFSTLQEFYDHFTERAQIDKQSCRNLDAFNDVLRGGFGTPEGGTDNVSTLVYYPILQVLLSFGEVMNNQRQNLATMKPLVNFAKGRNDATPTTWRALHRKFKMQKIIKEQLYMIG